MKHSVLGFALILAPSIVSAQLIIDPEKKAAITSPKSVLVQHEWIQLSSKQANLLFFGDKLDRRSQVIRKDVQALIDSNKAKVVNSSVLIVKDKETARIEAVKKDIYPTEFDPPEIIGTRIIPPSPTAFEERPVGLIVEAHTIISKDRNFIEINQDAEWTTKQKNWVWREFKHKGINSDIFMPCFTTLNIIHHIPLKNEVVCLTAMFSAIDENGNVDHNTKILHFTTATIIENK